MNFEESIDLSLEGKLSEEEWGAFQRELLKNPELLSCYVEQRWVHAQLTSDQKFLAESANQREEKTSLSATETRKQGRISIFAGWAAAAAITVFSFVVFQAKPEVTSPVATLIEAENCRWDGSDLPTAEGARLSPGTLALAEGMATIQFDSGAKVTLEAPTTLRVDSAMRCRLLDGSVVADVPELAYGFAVDTEKLEVIDLGTKFGVTSSEVGGSHVFVFDGEVKVREGDTEKARHVFGGKSLHFGSTPDEPDAKIDRSDSLLSLGPDWFAISTDDGGKDVYMRRSDGSGQPGDHLLLMVKHTDLAPGNERRALLGFDLRKLNRTQIAEVKLSLKIEPSGLGFSSLVPDSEFAVYGVLDPAILNWQESSILYETMPEFTTEKIDAERFIRLASFRVPKGASHSKVEVQSGGLTDFLLSSGKEKITLMLVRETGELDKQGLVHAFASKEHPTSPAPTLWFRKHTDL